ncbi:MAG: abortive infection [Bacteroidetes bacterium]|nr:MAG: abortive infection [Bacteroidota bacterium]
MRAGAFFSNLSSGGQILLLIGLVLAGTVFSIVLASGVSILVWGTDVLTQGAAVGSLNLDFLRTFQMISQVGIFILPPFIFGLLVNSSSFNFLGFRRPDYRHLIAAVLIIAVAGPTINFLVEWNEGLRLPGFLKSIEQWMRNSEETATRLTKQFLETSKTSDLIINFIMIAILPAIGEELLFRSALIGILRKVFKGIHWPVIISALIFSAFHLQFFGFVPRFALGLVLGYLFVWSGSVWVPMLAHLVNNGVVVVVSWLSVNKIIESNVDDLADFGSWIAVVVSVFACILILYLTYRTRPVEEMQTE